MGLWQFVTNQGPSPRYGHAMAYDEARGMTVLFGGYLCEGTLCSPGSPGGAVAYNDTWEWDGTTWTERVVANPPPARWFHAMAYDSVRQRVVAFGGRSTNPSAEFLGDLWEWDGTTWAERATLGDPAAGHGVPTGRWDHGLAFDRARNVLVLHGGLYHLPSSNGAGETWELSSTGQWTLRAVAPNVVDGPYQGLWWPVHHAMTYDYDRGATLLATFGYEGGNQGRLWEWTGSEWTSRATFPWRDHAVMAYDDVRARTALVGGESGYLSRPDVWEWRYFDAPPTCEPPP